MASQLQKLVVQTIKSRFMLVNLANSLIQPTGCLLDSFDRFYSTDKIPPPLAQLRVLLRG